MHIFKTPNPDGTPQQDPPKPAVPGQKNPNPVHNNPSDLPRPGTDPNQPID